MSIDPVSLAAIRIVRNLASLAAPLDGEFGYCHLCKADFPGSDPIKPEDHEVSCPWRRAVEWSDAYDS